MGQRKVYSGEFKAKVVLELIKGQRTANEIAGSYGVHPVQAAQWKKQALEGLAKVMADRRVKEDRERDTKEAELYEEIGRLKMALEWLKKKSGISPERNG